MKKIFAIGIFLFFCASARAAEIIVTNAEQEAPAVNDGDCSLAEAILAASRNVSVDACPAGSADAEDIIRLGANAHYFFTQRYPEDRGTLKTALPHLSGNITIEGNGALLERNADAPLFRLLAINLGHPDGTVTLRNLTFRGGNNTETLGVEAWAGVHGGLGGAILHGGTLRVERCHFVNNVARWGSAVYSFNTLPNHLANLIVEASTVSDHNQQFVEGQRGATIFYLEGNGTFSDTIFRNNTGAMILLQGGINGYIVRGEASNRPAQNGTLRIVRTIFKNNRGDMVHNGVHVGQQYFNRQVAPYGPWARGQTYIKKSSFLNNAGAGLINYDFAWVHNSAFAGNSSSAVISYYSEGVAGGANTVSASYTHVANSTIANNLLGEDRGVFWSHAGSIKVINSTVVGNGSEGNPHGAFYGGGTIRIQNSIVSGNGSQECQVREGRDGWRPIESLGNNIFGRVGNCRLTPGPNDQLETDPRLGAISGMEDEIPGNEFFPLAEASPAIDAGNPEACVNSQATPDLDKDQTGRAREGVCDIGSAEMTSIVHHWAFDEVRPADGAIMIPDVSGNNKDGQLGGANGMQSLVPGVRGNALQCNGADNFVKTARAVSVGVQDHWTISWWQNLNRVDTQQNIFTIGAPSDNPDQNALSYFDFILIPGGSINMNYTGQNGAARGLDSPGPVLTGGAWQYVVLTNSGEMGPSMVKLYINGVEKPIEGVERLSPQGEHPRFITVCRDWNRNIRFADGKVDEFMIRKRVLGADEVMRECRAGAEAAGIVCGQ